MEIFQSLYPVFDLHCDLLAYLARGEGRSSHDLEVRCSVPQMRKGGVKVQTLAAFCRTERGSSEFGWRQAEVFKNLGEEFFQFGGEINPSSDKIGILFAFENASGFCGEEDELRECLKKLERLHEELGKILYISLTWNGENRFGGGAGSRVGLLDDGKRLLDFLP